MAATFTFDVFSTLDGFGSPKPGSWGGYWDKPVTELEAHRLNVYGEPQRMVLGASTYRLFAHFLAIGAVGGRTAAESWVTRMLAMPATVVSNSLEGPLDWPDATVASGDAVDIITQLKEKSDVPLRSHGSLALNRSLMAAGLVDRIQVTLFPVITGKTGADPIFQDAADFDLELIDARTFDSSIQELTYAPTLHG